MSNEPYVFGSSPRIAQWQAMQLIFDCSEDDYCALEKSQFAPNYEGTEWEKRSKEKQRKALWSVINLMFYHSICGQHLGSNCPVERRKMILGICEKAGPNLLEYGWSMHDVTDWLVETNQKWQP